MALAAEVSAAALAVLEVAASEAAAPAVRGKHVKPIPAQCAAPVGALKHIDNVKSYGEFSLSP